MVSVVALAACGRSASEPNASGVDPLVVRDSQLLGSGLAAQGKGRACPAADKVVLIEPLYDANDESAPPIGWNLPLAARPAPEGASTSSITPEEAKAMGVGPVPRTVWIYRAGQPPCRGKVGELTRDLDDAPGSMSIDARIDGCAPPGRDESGPWLGLAVDAEPKGCELATPSTIAERVGEADGETWVRPSADTPIPAAIAPMVPKAKAACAPPACEPLWQVRAAQVAGKPIAYEATLTWVRPEATLALCSLAHEDDHALFTVGKTGAKKLDDGAGPWQRLVGVFYDATGPRQIVLTARGVYTVRPIGGDGSAGAPVTRTWYLPNVEEPATWSLAQYCGE
jgi:hypothetical protein